MIVGVCGHGYSGSGAVVDYLKEKPDCQVCGNIELSLAYMPHGLQDLDYHVNESVSRYYSSDAAIKDFLRLHERMHIPRTLDRRVVRRALTNAAEELVAEISQVSWVGWWLNDYARADVFVRLLRFKIANRLRTLLEEVFGRRIGLPIKERMYLSVQPDEFEDAARRYIANVLDGLGCSNERIVVLDQPFEANDPGKSMRYFDDSRAIVVDRDPRDLYLLCKLTLGNKAAFIPSDDPETFARYYRLVRASGGAENDSGILRVSFEDLVYEYEDTARRIDSFLGLGPTAEGRFEHFDPAISINNTQLFVLNSGYREEVELIEKLLPEYLYPFDEHDLMPSGGRSF